MPPKDLLSVSREFFQIFLVTSWLCFKDFLAIPPKRPLCHESCIFQIFLKDLPKGSPGHESWICKEFLKDTPKTISWQHFKISFKDFLDIDRIFLTTFLNTSQRTSWSWIFSNIFSYILTTFLKYFLRIFHRPPAGSLDHK